MDCDIIPPSAELLAAEVVLQGALVKHGMILIKMYSSILLCHFVARGLLFKAR